MMKFTRVEILDVLESLCSKAAKIRDNADVVECREGDKAEQRRKADLLRSHASRLELTAQRFARELEKHEPFTAVSK